MGLVVVAAMLVALPVCLYILFTLIENLCNLLGLHLLLVVVWLGGYGKTAALAMKVM